MQTTTITDIRTIGITVADQDNALEFFTGILGFDKRLDAPISPTMRWIEVAPPGATTSIALVRGASAPTGGTDTAVRFTVPDVTAEHAALREKEVVVSDIMRWDGVPPMFTFDDPDGNRFVIVEGSR